MAEEEKNNLAIVVQQVRWQLIEQFDGLECMHGVKPPCPCVDFLAAFSKSCREATGGGANIIESLLAGADATMGTYTDIWEDSTKMKIAVSYAVFAGAQRIVRGDLVQPRCYAVIARYFEQYIAVALDETQALINWLKIEEVSSDNHTLVKFFRRRIPCSCLDEKYEEVKDMTKMGICCNPQCQIPYNLVERSKTKCCSRCRCVTYCSRECQEADWSRHKPSCDRNTALKAEFEAKQQQKE